MSVGDWFKAQDWDEEKDFALEKEKEKEKEESQEEEVFLIGGDLVVEDKTSDKKNTVNHYVKRGQSLKSIAKLHRVSEESIKELNDMKSDSVKGYDKLKIARKK